MSEYLSSKKAKKAIIDIGQRMYVRGFVAANDGNISVRVSENEVWTTPTGVSKGFMTKDMLVKTDLEGNVIKGERKPSSELKMHLRAYKEDPELRAVVHAHPPLLTAFGISNKPLNLPILAEAVITLGEVPIVPYAELGSTEVPESIAPYVKSHNGVILANHGAVTWGDDPYGAYYRMESMEYYAKILLISEKILGSTNELKKEEITKLLEMREKFGIKRGGVPKGYNED